MNKKQLTSWSFSRYSSYRQCPLKARLAFIERIKEPPNKAMARGAAIHDLAEGYIKGTVARLPKELGEFGGLFRRLRKQYKKKGHGMVVEDMWAFTKEWDETAWDNWTACWVRIKLDCAEHEDDKTLIINDWKTGKFRHEMSEDYIEQLELYALAALLLHDHIETVKPRLVYLDQGSTYPKPGSDDEKALTFIRKDIPKLKKLWAKRVRPMLNDRIFAPRPNNRCCWCFYRKANAANGGGQCKY